MSVVVTTLFGTSVAADADDGPKGPLKVLVTGDSRTQGYHGDHSWRYRLAREFARQHVAVDFVGSARQPFVASGYTRSSYAIPSFDSAHFARVGAQLRHQVNQIAAEVREQQPDVIVLGSGLNDLLQGVTPEDTVEALHRWVANVQEAKPGVSIIVTPVFTMYRSGYEHMPAVIKRYNTLARAEVARLDTAESPVVMTASNGWAPNRTYTTDGVHPTSTGEAVIAQRVAETLHKVGVLPQPPAIFIGKLVPWQRNLRPLLSLRNGAAHITWDHQKLSGAQIYLRRRGGAWRVVPGTRQWSHTTERLVPGAVYDVRLRGVRFQQVAVLGPTASISRLVAPRWLRVERDTLRWASVAGAGGYRYSYVPRGGSRWVHRTTPGTVVKVRASRARVVAYNAYASSSARQASR